MKNHYYLCAYGHVTRRSVQQLTLDATRRSGATAAALYCFGVTNRVTTIYLGTRKAIPRKKLVEFEQRLAERHFAMTGNILGDQQHLPADDFPCLHTLANLKDIAALKSKECLVNGDPEGRCTATIEGELTVYMFEQGRFVGFQA